MSEAATETRDKNDEEVESESTDPQQQLKFQQAREKKELQAKIASLKHGVTKQDKKRKKEVMQQVESMEKELKEKHDAELKALESKMAQLGHEPAQAEEEVKVPEKEGVDEGKTANEEGKKMTKAHLRREKKAGESKRRHAAALEDERNAEHSEGRVEKDQLETKLMERGLALHEIIPDGDCLFNSLAHQLAGKLDGSALRKLAAKQIREHLNEYLPFLSNPDGEPLNGSAEIETYLRGVEQSCANGGAWGGEAEIRAISSAICRQIEVVQPSGKSTIYAPQEAAVSPPVGEQNEKNLVVTYHRFAYALGEHYNSTVPLEKGV